ncbi:hypothetical protein BD779DRAFT_1450173 [Infundibulicybe gibba]|nr:hypothetical protein BD779DRAFT_1450173 [Infundibulicybe gibba]
MFPLIKTFYKFTCQDLPFTIKDTHDEFFATKNPSNLRFEQFIFECLSGLMRFVAGTPTTLATFEQALFGPFTIILQ